MEDPHLRFDRLISTREGQVDILRSVGFFTGQNHNANPRDPHNKLVKFQIHMVA
jgi:hypothetical protein